MLRTGWTIAALLLATLAAQAAVELLPGAFFAPASFGQHDLEPGLMRLRTAHDFLLYVTDPGPVTVTMTCDQVGRYGNDATARVDSPEGEALAEGTAAVGESVTLSFEAAEVGPYALHAGAGRNGFTLGAEGAKLLLPAGADGQPLEGVSHGAPVYLCVPPGAREFTVALGGQGTGETAAARVLAPDGAEVAALSTAGAMGDSATIAVPAGADDNVWALIIEPAEAGLFEDFNARLGGDVSPWVAQRPEDALCPAINTSSERVSRERRDRVLPVSVTTYLDLAELTDAAVVVEAAPFDGGEAVWSQRLAELPGRSADLAPAERLPDGKYRWSLALLQGDEAVKRFGGTWWYVPAPNYVTDDQTTLFNGEPFFARGLYHVQPEDYELVASQGFNAVQCPAPNVPAAEAAGLAAGVQLYASGRPDSDRWREAMDSVVDNDCVFSWWIQDEPGGGADVIEMLADAYTYIRTHDPDRPAYTCLNNPNTYPQFAPQTDIVSADVYPIGRSPLTVIADTLDHGRDVIPRHVRWFIGQIWPWPDSPLVTPAQHRCMTYLALAHGARGLFWYSFRDPNWYVPDNNPDLWDELKVVNDELIALEPALLTPNVAQAVIGGDGGEVHAALKRVGNELTVIAANPGEEPVSASIDVADMAEGADLAPDVEVMFEDRQLQLADGAFADDFEPLTAHVYRLMAQ